MTATEAGRIARLPNWIAAAAPLVLVGALAAIFLLLDPIARLRPIPPVEAVAVERSVLDERGIELYLRGEGADEVTIAQVLVNDAYWDFSIGDATLGRLETTRLSIPYPWEEGLPLRIGLVTSTGLVIEHDIEAAASTPRPDLRTFGIYALLGIYIGVIPVAIGLLWFPALARAPARWIGFFLAFTAGLLAFLLVDTVAEGLELGGRAGALDGSGLFAIGALGAVLGLLYLETRLDRRPTSAGAASGVGGLRLAYLIAAGIGLHNLGEGLAVGAALAGGEIALGTFLVLGFALHNTTEGLAIVSPLGAERTRPALWHFAALGALAGVPTIFGAWLGGFAFAPAWAALSFGVAAGAIAQVIWTIGRSMRREQRAPGAAVAGFMAGLVVMYLTALLVPA